MNAFSFDTETMKKIGMDFLHSIAVTVLLGVINTLFAMVGQVHIADPAIASLFMLVSLNIYNVAKNYVSGS
jgi:hypothetical protein